MRTLHDYQEAVTRTCATADLQETLKLALVGLQDELGEIAGPLKKYLWHGHGLDRSHLQDEVGDVLWYLATLCNALGIALEEALQGNIEKLQGRYPDGFSCQRSRTRPSEGEHRSDNSPPISFDLSPLQEDQDALALTLSLLRVNLWGATNNALSFSSETPTSTEEVTQLGVQLGRLIRVLARRHIYPIDETSVPLQQKEV